MRASHASEPRETERAGEAARERRMKGSPRGEALGLTMKSTILLGAMGVLMAGALGCGRGGDGNTPAADSPRSALAPAADRKYLLERVDDAAVVQLYANGSKSCR